MFRRFLHPTTINTQLIVMWENAAPMQIVLCRKPVAEQVPHKDRNFQWYLVEPNWIWWS